MGLNSIVTNSPSSSGRRGRLMIATTRQSRLMDIFVEKFRDFVIGFKIRRILSPLRIKAHFAVINRRVFPSIANTSILSELSYRLAIPKCLTFIPSGNIILSSEMSSDLFYKLPERRRGRQRRTWCHNLTLSFRHRNSPCHIVCQPASQPGLECVTRISNLYLPDDRLNG